MSNPGNIKTQNEINSNNLTSKIYEIEYENGLKYRGKLNENDSNPIGIGKYEFPNGDIYIGEVGSRISGELICSDKTIYKGQFFNYEKSGLGEEKYPDGSVYSGMFKKNKKSGRGKIVFNNNDIYEGGFKNGVRWGIGTYSISNGGVFVGDWKEDYLEGKGKWMVGNGSEIPGEFEKSLSLIHI